MSKQRIGVPVNGRPRTTSTALPLLLASVISLLPARGSAQGVGQCLDQIDTYRSLVIHQGSDEGASITLPDLSSFALTGDRAISDPGFWVDPEDELGAFSMRRTLQQMVETDPDAGLLNEEEIKARIDRLARSWIDSFSSEDSFVPRTKTIHFALDGRPAEADLKVSDILAMRPVALFNRIDLRDGTGETCGEHRIVYQLPVSELELSGKMFLIFEAELVNPHPERGPAGCLPVAKHWAEAADLKDKDLATHMEALFYEGIPGFRPAVHFEQLGAPYGQLRGNLFLSPFGLFGEWQLREWHIASEQNPRAGHHGEPVFVLQPTADTALAELYSASRRDSQAPDTVQLTLPPGSDPHGDPVDLTWRPYLALFQESFQAQTVPHLLAPEQGGMLPQSKSGVALVNAIRAPMDPDFTEFQATSQNGGELPTGNISDELSAMSACWLANGDSGDCGDIEPIPGTQRVTTAMLFERAKRAGTCDGCHRVPNDAEISQDVFWPRDAQFVHVTETGNLSDALHGTFLPDRSKKMLRMIKDAPTGDANLDGAVDVQDVSVLLAHWGEQNQEVDLNCDGLIDSGDLLEVLAGWGAGNTERSAAQTEQLDALLQALPLSTGRGRASLLADIEAERTRVGEAQDSLPDMDGQPRRTH